MVWKYLHSDFKNSQQPQSSEDREPERSSLGLEMAPDDLEDAAGDDEAVEPVERGLEVDPWSQSPHTEQHLKDEQAQKDKFGSVWKRKPKLSFM